MTHQDDTDLDALAAQVRAFPPLNDDEVRSLLGRVRAGQEPAREELVDHHLNIALDEVLAHGNRGMDVVDLYQEGAVATIVAVSEYASRGGAPAGLRTFVRRVVDAHLESALEDAAIETQSEEAFVRDAQVYETAEVGLRQELGRSATVMELAAVLHWPEERVALVGEMLDSARAIYDADIAQYLDES
ncbi:MAG: hypothetical protein JOZ46_09010 [Candidatus Dormibacteraeota bacterium]|nr:hypothetical protein [Candidatus Dormibacteraeota bacterium]